MLTYILYGTHKETHYYVLDAYTFVCARVVYVSLTREPYIDYHVSIRIKSLSIACVLGWIDFQFFSEIDLGPNAKAVYLRQ